MGEKKDEFELPYLDCGHVLSLPNNGAGKCRNCGAKCCARCLILVNGDLLCPLCFIFLVRG